MHPRFRCEFIDNAHPRMMEFSPFILTLHVVGVYNLHKLQSVRRSYSFFNADRARELLS